MALRSKDVKTENRPKDAVSLRDDASQAKPTYLS